MLREAFVEQARIETSTDIGLVHLLSDEDQLLGAVAEAGVPDARKCKSIGFLETQIAAPTCGG